MAKTPASETPLSPILRSDTPSPYPSFHQRRTILRKRVRRVPSGEPIILGDTTHEGPAKTRRVNPQNLADRLGPELVRDMEAHIFPGAKMPTFSVRKELQERYTVDRRHIYDYFHSRGLRVAKEDKHTNLVKGRSSTVKARSRSCSKSSPDLSNDAIVHGSNDSDRTRRNHVLVVNIPPICSKYSVQSREPEHTHNVTQPQLCFPHSYELLNQSRPRSSPNTNDETLESNTFSPYGSLEFELLATSPIDSYFHDGYPSEQTMELDDLKINTLRTPGSSTRGCFRYPLLPVVDDHHLLLQDERVEFYNLVSSSIGPARGIQESAGTYKAYMKERSRLYFDRLFSSSRKTTYYKAAYNGDPMSSPVHMQHQLSARSGVDSAAAITRDNVNFQRWLLATVSFPDPHEDSDSLSERSHCVHESWNIPALPTASKQAIVSNESGTLDLSRPIPLPPADDLFPEPPCGIYASNSAVLPVLRSDPINPFLDIVEGIDGKEKGNDEREPAVNPLFYSSRSMKPKAINTSASAFRRISHKMKHVMLPSPTLFLNTPNNQRQPLSQKHPAAADTSMDTSISDDFSTAYSARNSHPGIRKQSFSAGPTRLRTSSAGGGI